MENTKRRKTTVEQARKVKQWNTIWWKWILIWILVFIMLIISIIFFFFFYLVKHPSVGKNIWFSISAIKSIAWVFAWIFFGFFFLLFLILWLSYLYKLATKPTGKFKNAIGNLSSLFYEVQT